MLILMANFHFIDAHHDKGHSTHTSGAHLKDQEGTATGSKQGERDRGFVKEQKAEEAHDAAYDTKERKFHDGEQHKEEIKEEKSKETSVGQKEKQEEVVPAVSFNNYLGRQSFQPKISGLPTHTGVGVTPETAYTIGPLQAVAALANTPPTPGVVPQTVVADPLHKLQSFRKKMLDVLFPHLSSVYFYY